MDPPRTPGRSAKYTQGEAGPVVVPHTTSAASPFSPSEPDSPRFRASTKAYGGRTRSYGPALTSPAGSSYSAQTAHPASPSAYTTQPQQALTPSSMPASAQTYVPSSPAPGPGPIYTPNTLAPPIPAPRTPNTDGGSFMAPPLPPSPYLPQTPHMTHSPHLAQSPQPQLQQQLFPLPDQAEQQQLHYNYPASPPTPRAPSAPRRFNHSNDSVSNINDGSEGALAVPRTPSRSHHRSGHSRGHSLVSTNGHQRTPSASASARANSINYRARGQPHSAHGGNVHAGNVHVPSTPESQMTAAGATPAAAGIPGAVAATPMVRKVQKRTSIGPWEFVKSIGAGSMGQVKLAVHRYTRQTAAVKIVPKAFTQRSKDGRESNESKDARVVREAAIGRLLSHPNISKLYDVYSMTGHFYLVFEYISGGQMLDYIIAHGCVKEVQARRFARSICSALDYCHQNSIVHRDLKIENILIADNGDIKLIDFGLSNLFRRDDLLRTFCGSLYFAAPELLNALPYIGPEIDVWSFGVVLYVLVCGKVPFEDKSMTVLHAKIKRGTVDYPSWLSSQCVDLLRLMLTVNPVDRATLSEVCHHPWMMKGFDGPPESYVPRRTPLVSEALDLAVIEEMEQLGIGKSSDIERSLRTVLESADYHASVDSWYDKQQVDLASNSLDTAFSVDARSANPLNSFSPEISCYFLTRERMDRIPLQPQQPPQPIPQAPQQPHHQKHPSITVVPSEPEEMGLKVGRTRARTIGSDYKKTQDQKEADYQKQVDFQKQLQQQQQQQQQLSIPPPAFVSNVMQAQVGRVAPVSAVKSIEITPFGAVQVPDEKPHERPNRVVSQPVPSTTSQQQSQQPMSLLRKFSLRRSTPKTGHVRAKSTSHAHDMQRKPFDDEGTQGMPSIESPKPVYFKGIFSVSTTSTKPLREIRDEIIRVLTSKRIEYVEVKGGFACVARPYQVMRSQNDELLRTPSKMNGQLSATTSPGTPPSTPRTHRPRFSENGVLSPAGSTGGSVDSIDMEIGASDMLGGNTQKSSIPVRFEIDIVRVPIVALYGIQFKKMTGNVWLYKSLAQGIVEDLRI